MRSSKGRNCCYIWGDFLREEDTQKGRKRIAEVQRGISYVWAFSSLLTVTHTAPTNLQTVGLLLPPMDEESAAVEHGSQPYKLVFLFCTCIIVWSFPKILRWQHNIRLPQFFRNSSSLLHCFWMTICISITWVRKDFTDWCQTDIKYSLEMTSLVYWLDVTVSLLSCIKLFPVRSVINLKQIPYKVIIRNLVK